MVAAIPYTTFPDLPLGFNTFGLMVALGVLVGAVIGAGYGERFGVDRDTTYRTGTYMVLAGIVGSRITWVLTHTDRIASPLDEPWESFVDAIAIWRGGIQFAGGFIAALIVGVPMMRGWERVQRWHVLNGYALGLAAGVAIGRIGCYAVGEHFGRETSFFLGTRYEGGTVRETDALGQPALGDTPLLEGMTFHNTALYEMMHLAVLAGIMGLLVLRVRRSGRELPPASLVGLFFLWYGVLRFVTDTVRVNDERVLSMTGAQWMSLVLVPFGVYVLVRLRPELERLAAGAPAAGAAAGLLAEDAVDDDDGDEIPVPDEVEPPEDDEDHSFVSGPDPES